jgi:predicted ATPase/signal transduction histidine kinase
MLRDNEGFVPAIVTAAETNLLTDPPTLTGRETSLPVLRQWLLQSANEDASLLLVEGEAGIGKTTFVNQLAADLRTSSDFFVYGKFHQSPSGVPYQALKQCLRHWLDQLLLLEDTTFERLRDQVRQVVYPHAGVLTSVLEELELLLGKKSSTSEEVRPDPQKERFRFTYYFHKFLRAVYDSGHKMIIFLDDLQWADVATIDLIHNLLKIYHTPGLLLLGAYRSLHDDPLLTKLTELLKMEQVRHFKLPPFQETEVTQLIPANWQLDLIEKKALAEYLLQESGGKPFDVLQLLSVIAQAKPTISSKDQPFQIQWDKLHRFKRDASTVQLIRREILKLRADCTYLLKIASCLGFYFSGKRLSRLSGLSTDEFKQAIQELLLHRMIVQQLELYYFVHDHYFTAAQSLLTETEKEKYHSQVAHELVAEGALELQHPDFLECTNHLNLASPDTIGLEPVALAVVNLSAAQLAKNKSAFDKSLEYYHRASQYLSRSASREQQTEIQLPEVIPHYSWLPTPLRVGNLCLVYHLGRAESEFLVQNYQASDQLLDEILQQETDRLVRLKAYTLKMKIFVANLNNKDAHINLKDGVDMIESLLDDYQIQLPQTEVEFSQRIRQEYKKLVSHFRQVDIDNLEDCPITEDQEYHDFIRLIIHALPIIFFINIRKAKYLALQALVLSFQRGFTPGTPVLLASATWIVASIGKDYRLANRLGLVGLSLVEKEPYKIYRHVVYHFASLNFFNWSHHYREASVKLRQAFEFSLESGDHNYAVFCFTNYRLIDLFRGVPLEQLADQQFRPKDQFFSINFISQSHLAFINFMTGKSEGLVEGKFIFSKNLKHKLQETLTGIYHFHFVLELLYMHAGCIEQALEAGNVCERNRMLYEAFPVGGEHDFYYCMILFMNAEEQGSMNDEHRAIIATRLKELTQIAEMGSGNFLHKQRILEAELARQNQQYLEAITLYDQGIEEAVKQEFIQLAALASERCGSFMLKMRKRALAEVYLNDAYRYYQLWGAKAKMRVLEQQYPEIYFRKVQYTFNKEEHLTTEQDSLKWDMVQTVLNLSQELYVNDLICKVLEISVAQTHAKFSSFLLKQSFGWQVAAKLDQEGFSIVHQNIPNTFQEAPYKALLNGTLLRGIRYVPKLSEQPDLYDIDYFKSKVVHSFLIVPFERMGETLGSLYLENVAIEAIESKNLLPWFELLRTQTSITLSNAQLFESQLKHNQEIRQQEQRRIDAVVETQEKERRRVAAELHDNLGQLLALVKLNLSQLEDSLEGQFPLYLETCQLLDDSCHELRRIAHDMMPPDLEQKPLPGILEDLFRRHLSPTGLVYRFQCGAVPENLPVSVKFNLYRMAQEILHNIIKHANARMVSVELTTREGQLHMIIADDGSGFDIQFKTDGLGLRNLYNRVNMLNGRVNIDSTIQQGSVFHIQLPIL